jgi:hypothetical protein
VTGLFILSFVKPWTMVTPSFKDKVLYYLVESFPLEQPLYFRTSGLKSDTGIGYLELYTILHELMRLNHITNLVVGEHYTSFILCKSLADFAMSGGFTSEQKNQY